MIFAVTILTNLISTFTFEVNGCGIEKYQFKFSEQIAPYGKQLLFNKIFYAPGRKRSFAGLVINKAAKKSHGTVKMVQG